MSTKHSLLLEPETDIEAAAANESCRTAPVRVNLKQVTKRQPLSSFLAGSARSRQYVAQAMKSLRQHARPRIIYRRIPLNRAEGRVRFGGHLLRSRKISRALRGCDAAYIYLLTLGPRIDEIIRRRQRDNSSLAAVTDQAASAFVEQALYDWRRNMARQPPAELGLTLPYSPGYCDWSIEAQREIFSMLPFHPLGVSLSPQNLMEPRKSTSGLMGIGAGRSARRFGNACRACRRYDCPFRRTKEL